MDEISCELSVLVGVIKKSSEKDECSRSLNELEKLVNTAGGECFCKVIQLKETFDPRTLIGSGKIKEIADIVSKNNIKLVVFDQELTPAQIRNLENDIGDDVVVIDRSMLILDIFALHATSAEGKLQVELAQLKYTAPRLTGKGSELSRQGGGIGSRGPGESKLETDKRHLHERIRTLEARLKEIESTRGTMRQQRDRSGIFKVALVGYTNAGKSTLLNLITGANVLSEDKLFATLTPTTRKCELPCGEQILLTDTVGFIRKLPHHLVESFKSTLDEVRYADMLLIVSDASDDEVYEHIEVAEDICKQLGAEDKPRIYVFNKYDKLNSQGQITRREDTIYISAKYGTGIDELMLAIEQTLHKSKQEKKLIIPYTNQGVLNSIYNEYTVKDVEYTDCGIEVTAVLDSKGVGLYSKYFKE